MSLSFTGATVVGATDEAGIIDPTGPGAHALRSRTAYSLSDVAPEEWPSSSGRGARRPPLPFGRRKVMRFSPSIVLSRIIESTLVLLGVPIFWSDDIRWIALWDLIAVVYLTIRVVRLGRGKRAGDDRGAWSGPRWAAAAAPCSLWSPASSGSCPA
ncbi:hypothetical protein [Saccharothrix yanglingensis]|uniref:hypothetical protein n=1 Tax=Saccharothrix yanglingensis TaxID=659496 RepID=UPI0027D2F3AD|nr:hypothetical protein [Saccharothrix yanglingensis]